MGNAIQIYEGNDPYIFCSFCDEDRYFALPVIESLANSGYRVWFDVEGDLPFKTIALRLSNSRACLSLISKASANSHICRNNINLTLEQDVLLIPVLLEEFALTPAMRLLLAGKSPVKASAFSLESPKGMEEFLKTVLRPSECDLCRQAAFKDKPWSVSCVSAAAKNCPPPKPVVSSSPSVSGITAYLSQMEQEKAESKDVQAPAQEPLSVIKTGADVQEDAPTFRIYQDEQDSKTVVLSPKPRDERILIDLGQGKVYRLMDGVTRLGRSKINDHCFSDKAISAKHAQLFINANGRAMVRDVGSTNGTFINRVRLDPADPKEAGNFSIISLADHHFLYLNGESAQTILQTGVGAFLTCEENGDIVGLHPGFVLGRENPWPSGAFSEKSVSREHGAFSVDKGGYRFVASRSTNGTTFDRKPMVDGQDTGILKNGDEIGVAGIHRVVYHVVKLQEERK